MQSKFNASKNIEKENNLGICLKKPCSISYATVAARIRSYSNWTRSSPRPVDLADAGFFYTGTEDMVQCFYCGLKLRSWDVFDNPWVEHARHGKNCPHVSNVKGDQFYKQLKQDEEDELSNKPVTKRCLYSDDLIRTTAAQALFSMGCYKEQDIMDAIKLFVAEKDTLEFHASDILTVLLKHKSLEETEANLLSMNLLIILCTAVISSVEMSIPSDDQSSILKCTKWVTFEDIKNRMNCIMMLLALSSYNAVLAAVIPPTEPNKLQPIVHNCINGLQKFIVDPTRLLSSYGNDTNNVHFKSYKIMFHPPNNYQSKLGNFFKYDIRTRTVTILKDGYARFNIVVSLNTRRVLNRSIQIMLKLVIGGEEKINYCYVFIS
ncbi:unnamed protein product [Mytilus edulis]|uniref:Uncharacterized protein n=1 Tax=Mytilus edulis TaxID=6550 RepID=A0A8S3S0I7_MYTED|nr:unnamed protein product [Mytilus edulis]